MSASSEYFAAVRAIALWALNRLDPTISNDNVLLWPVRFSWNDGDVVRPSKIIATLDANSGSTFHNYDRIDAVWAKRKDVENFLATGRTPIFLLVYFMGDDAFAYARMRPLESYIVSKYDSLRTPMHELTYVLTLTMEEKHQAQAIADAAVKAAEEKQAGRIATNLARPNGDKITG